MNLLIIGTTDILGGAAKVSWDIKTAMQKNGHCVKMFVADKRSQDINVKSIPRILWRNCLDFILARETFINTDWIINTEEFKKADMVHCHNLHGRFFSLNTLQKMSMLKPVVWTLHDEWALTPHCAYTFEGNKMQNGLYTCKDVNVPPRILWDNTAYLSRWKNKLYSKSKFHIITPSIWLKKRVENTILKNQDVRLIPNGIDTDVFKMTPREEARSILKLPIDKKIILFLANSTKNNPWKGWAYTEKVISHYKDVKNMIFLNVGNLEKYDNESNVRYIGHIDKMETLALYYSAADALLFTSTAENFPLVILEAMSCGLPIITFDVGGVKEVVVHKENGYVTEYLNTDGLISGVKWLSELDTKNLLSISQKSSDKIRDDYDTKKMTNSYLALYNEIYGQN